MVSLREFKHFPMIRVALLASMATLSVLTAIAPAHAEGGHKQANFDEKKAQKLDKAEARAKKAQAKVACIKAAEDMEALKMCK